MPEATACAPSVVADTIMRTIELGVMIIPFAHQVATPAPADKVTSRPRSW